MEKLVSIIAPLYNEEGNVRELVAEIKAVMDHAHSNYELILVNDGSSDATWKEVLAISKENPKVMGIDLAGNYGQTISLRAGFDASKGDIVVMMDGDLQHNPKYIPEFLKLIDQGYDMVGGSKENRPDGLISRIMSPIAHKIISLISGVKMKYFGATFRAYRRYLLENINLLGDTHRFLGAIVARKGIRYTEIPIEIRQRKTGRSNYKLKKIIFVILDLVFLKFTISYMNKPFRLFATLGGIIFSIGSLFTMALIISALFLNVHIKQDYLAEFLFFISMMLIGLFLISIGIIAEIGIYNYFGKDRNPYRVRQVLAK